MFTIDPSTDFGALVSRKLRDEQVIWLTAVDSHGAPQPNPVWFYWDGEIILIYTQPGSHKVRHLKNNPKVSLHFNSTPDGSDVIVITGEAAIQSDYVPATQVPAYIEKYLAGIRSLNSSPEEFAAEYSLPILVRPTHLRGF